MNQGPWVSSVKHYCCWLWFDRHQVGNLVKTMTTLNFSFFLILSKEYWRSRPRNFPITYSLTPYQARQILVRVDTMTKNRLLSPVTTNSSPPEARAFPQLRSKLIKLVGAFASWWRIIRLVCVCVCVCVCVRARTHALRDATPLAGIAVWADAAFNCVNSVIVQLFLLARTCMHRLLCCIQSNFVFENLCILTQGVRYGSIKSIRQYGVWHWGFGMLKDNTF
jgi:hypothetical protein